MGSMYYYYTSASSVLSFKTKKMSAICILYTYLLKLMLSDNCLKYYMIV